MAEKKNEYSAGDEHGMLVSSTGSKWECFAGGTTEITTGVSSEYITGTDISSKTGGIFDFSHAATVEFTRGIKYEVIDIHGFMYDKEGLEYYGGAHSITTKERFFLTAGLNAAGEAQYKSCQEFLENIGNQLSTTHALIASAGLGISVSTATGKMPESSGSGVAIANNLPTAVSLGSQIYDLGKMYWELAPMFKKLVEESTSQPNAVIAGSSEKLLLGTLSPSGAGTEILQEAGVITMGAQDPAPGLIKAQGGIFGYASPVFPANIVIDGNDPPTITTMADNITATAASAYTVEATTMCTIKCGDNTILINPEGVTVQVGDTEISVTPAELLIKLGNFMLNASAASGVMSVGGSSIIVNESSILICSDDIVLTGATEISGTLSVD